MHIDKLSTTNAFVVTDLEEAPQSAGVVRSAKKVLQGSASALARTATYTFASRELKIGGASAGISADPGDRADAVAAFVAEIAPRVAAGDLVFDPGSGITAGELDELTGSDGRPSVRSEPVDGLALQLHLEALGPVIAAEAALGGLDGVTATVEASPAAPRLVRELVARGAKVVAFGGSKGVAHLAEGLDTDVLVESDDPFSQLGVDLQPADVLTTVESAVLFCGSRQGMIDGETAEATPVRLIVPTGCQPISAKGLAVLRRRGVLALADFVTTAGPTFAGWPSGDPTVDAVLASATAEITAAVSECSGHDDGPLLAACYRAEAFLASWQTTLPFGRPIA